MTNKEAIKHLEGVALILKSRHMCKSMDSNCSHDEIVEYREQFESIKMAIEILEKQEPMEAIERFCGDGWNDYFKGECPRCGKTIETVKRCPHCNQVIRWVEE